jgi:hypothetical protein
VSVYRTTWPEVMCVPCVHPHQCWRQCMYGPRRTT